MSWIAPKISWSAADGVRDADFNRIEGNILELYNSMALHDAISVYVGPSGVDAPGYGGSASMPYKTVDYALSLLPKNLNGKTVSITMAAGDYPNIIRISNFNGLITLNGAYNREITIGGLVVEAAIVHVNNLILHVGSSGVSVNNGAILSANTRVHVSGGTYCMSVTRGSTFIGGSTLDVSGATTAGIFTSGCSRTFATLITASNNPAVAITEQGSVLAYSSTNLTITEVAFVTRSGGRMYTGAQLYT